MFVMFVGGLWLTSGVCIRRRVFDMRRKMRSQRRVRNFWHHNLTTERRIQQAQRTTICFGHAETKYRSNRQTRIFWRAHAFARFESLSRRIWLGKLAKTIAASPFKRSGTITPPEKLSTMVGRVFGVVVRWIRVARGLRCLMLERP